MEANGASTSSFSAKVPIVEGLGERHVERRASPLQSTTDQQVDQAKDAVMKQTSFCGCEEPLGCGRGDFENDTVFNTGKTLLVQLIDSADIAVQHFKLAFDESLTAQPSYKGSERSEMQTIAEIDNISEQSPPSMTQSVCWEPQLLALCEFYGGADIPTRSKINNGGQVERDPLRDDRRGLWHDCWVAQ